MKPKKVVGVIGLGAMGRGIVKNLLASDFPLVVYDANPEAVEWCENQGAISKSSPEEVGAVSEVVLMSLPGPSVVKEVVLGTTGLLNSMRPNTYILDLSTIDPKTSKELYEHSKEKQVYFFDCPVSGGPKGADIGKLTIMVGGEEHYFQFIVPILESIGQDIIYMGPVGSGQTAKLCHNMVVATLLTTLGETFTIAIKSGLDPSKLAEVIDKGSAHNRVNSLYAQNYIERSHQSGKFNVNYMYKDVSLYTKMAADYHVPTFIGSQVYQLYEAAYSSGKGMMDSSAVTQVIEELAQFHKLPLSPKSVSNLQS